MQNRPALFLGRHFEDVIITLCVRWYLRYSLSYRDLEEMMVERELSVDHVTIWRWVQRYAPILNQRLRRELRRRIARGGSMRPTSRLLGNGPTSIGQSIPPATPSTFCCHRTGI